MKLGDWREDARKRLEAAGCPDPQTDADWLLCDALNVGRGELRLISRRELPPDTIALLEGWLSRRLTGEPLQYIEGFAYFMGMKLRVDARVLIPRQDTETLCQCALARIHDMKGAPRVLDLCTGSGALAAAIGQNAPNARVTASDISKDALAVAKINAPNARIVLGDLFLPLAGEEFDVIVCNPPYVSEAEMRVLQREVTFEPRAALWAGADGLEFYWRISADLSAHLSRGGYALFEVGDTQADAVMAILESAVAVSDRGIEKDLCDAKRVVWIRRETHCRETTPITSGNELPAS